MGRQVRAGQDHPLTNSEAINAADGVALGRVAGGEIVSVRRRQCDSYDLVYTMRDAKGKVAGLTVTAAAIRKAVAKAKGQS